MPEDLSSYVEERLTVSAKRINRYGQLKSNWADFLPWGSNMNAAQSMSYEFVYGLIFGQIHLT